MDSENNEQIAWIADHFYPHQTGGATLSDYYWIELLGRQGYIVDKFSNGTAEIDFARYDHVIVSNSTIIQRGLLEKAKKHKSLIVIVHGTLSAEPVSDFYKSARLVVGMSPSHAQYIRKQSGISNVTHASPYIPKEFIDYEQDTRGGNVYIGDIIAHKGIESILNYAKNKQEKVYFYGKNSMPNLLKQNKDIAIYSGELNTSEVPKIMNRYKYFVWMLERYGSFGRTIAEALLCGLELKINENNFGIFSYNWKFDDPIELRLNIEEEYLKFLSLFNG